MSNRAVSYNVYKVIVRNQDDKITGKLEIAALDRQAAQLAGEAWARDHDLKSYRVTVMVKFNGYRDPVQILVVPSMA